VFASKIQVNAKYWRPGFEAALSELVQKVKLHSVLA